MKLENLASRATDSKSIKKISIRTKLIIIFGLLIALSSAIQSIIAVTKAHTAIRDKIETQLTEKAKDVASIISARIEGLLNTFDGIANTSMLKDPDADHGALLAFLSSQKTVHSDILRMDFCDTNGIRYSGTNLLQIADREWYKQALRGKSVLSEPIRSRLDNSIIFVAAVPVYDTRGRLIRVLTATIAGSTLSKNVDDIVIGKTGHCYVVDHSGTIIAHKDRSYVENQTNIVTLAKTDKSYQSLAAYLDKAINADTETLGYYTRQGAKYIVANAIIRSNNWAVIVQAPLREMFDSLYKLRNNMILTSFIILTLSLALILFIAGGMVKPVRAAAAALKEIANGKGDLTVRLKLIGNDEVTEVSHYFNETIEKLGASIKSVGENSEIMQNIGDQLSANMTQTASAVRHINSNIESMKQQAVSQAVSVKETAGTIEKIIDTIGSLNNSIENQSASVVHSSASVEEMV